MLPRYRRLVEQLAQAGLLKVICGTDTLGVGINVPIRTVLFTGLAKFDGSRQRILRTREFLQIAGRAGRAGFDTAGYVVVQAPEHVIENERAKAKSEAKNAATTRKKKSKAQLQEAARGHGRLDRADLRQAGRRGAGAAGVADEGRQRDAAQRGRPRGGRLPGDCGGCSRTTTRSGAASSGWAAGRCGWPAPWCTPGVLTRLDEPDELGRRYVLTVDLPPDFALNQPLAHFALAALDVLDPESPEHTLDIVSVIESVLESPRQILFAQQHAGPRRGGRGDEGRRARVRRADGAARRGHLAAAAGRAARGDVRDLSADATRGCPRTRCRPKSIVREMYEQGMTFTDFVGRYQLARSEGLVLRYLTDAYRTLRQTVPDAHRTPELDDLVEWLGETVRQTDSSLLDEWEALTDPEHVRRAAWHGEPPPPPAADLAAGAAVPGDGAQRDVPPGRAGRPRRPRRR